MDPETRDMVETTLELARENNQMLRKVRGVQKREMIWRTVKFFVIVGLALGVFYYLEPFLQRIVGIYSSIFGAMGSGSAQEMFQNFGN